MNSVIKKLPTDFKKRILVCVGFFACIFLPWFFILEQVVKEYHLINLSIDLKIPFCEYFVIPYVFWYVYITFAFVYMLLFESSECFYSFCKMMFSGMIICLICYTIYPTGLNIRQSFDTGKNICTWIVALLYSIDPSANVFPSLHVFTCAGIALAYRHTNLKKEHKRIYAAIVTAAIVIIISTMPIKQHSVLDVISGIVLAFIIYIIVRKTYNKGDNCSC